MNTELTPKLTPQYTPIERLTEFIGVIIWEDNVTDSIEFSRANLRKIAPIFLRQIDALNIGESATFDYPQLGAGELLGESVYRNGVIQSIDYGLESWKLKPDMRIKAITVKRISCGEYHSTNKRIGKAEGRYTWIQLPLSGFMSYSEEYAIYTRLKDYDAIKHNGVHSF
jgi:hypothetical protein